MDLVRWTLLQCAALCINKVFDSKSSQQSEARGGAQVHPQLTHLVTEKGVYLTEILKTSLHLEIAEFAFVFFVWLVFLVFVFCFDFVFYLQLPKTSPTPLTKKRYN
jgi:hypothetical protein